MNKFGFAGLMLPIILFSSSCTANNLASTSNIPVSLDELSTKYVKNSKSTYRYFLFNSELNPCLYVQKINIVEDKVIIEKEVCKANVDGKTYDFKAGQGTFFDEVKWVENGLQFVVEYHPSGETALSFEMKCFVPINANSIEEPICKRISR